jgi:hypothetical protein
MFLGDWVVILCGVVGFLANCAFAYLTYKKGQRYRNKYVVAMTSVQRMLDDLNHPQHAVCGGCGKIVLGACPDCAVLSKLVG